MKKLFLLSLCVAIFGMTASAQNKAVLGVRAGLNVSDQTLSDIGGENLISKSNLSFHVGVAYQQPILKKLPLYVETGLYLAGRGAKSMGDVEDNGDDGDNSKLNMLYLQVPVLLSWHFNMKSVSLQPYVGAFYGLGIYGKLKENGEKINVFKTTTIEGEEVPQLLKRSEVGLRFGLGVAIKKHYYIGAGYDLGLTNIAKAQAQDEDEGGKLKNGSFFVSLGYNF